MAFVLGVVVNAVVIARVARDRELQKPTFMEIAGLAAADMMYLVGNLAFGSDNMAAEFLCIDHAYKKYLSIAVLIFWFSAAFHVCLLAVLRFLILTQPLLTRRMLTNRRVVLASAALWDLTVVCIGTTTAATNKPDEQDGTNNTMHVVGWVLTYLLPIVITTILHLVKIIFLRRSFTTGSSTQMESRRKLLKRMARTIAMVLLAGALLPFPKFLTSFILRDIVRVPTPSYSLHVGALANAIFLLNYCINPFIYAFNSPAFRKSINAMLGFRRGTAFNHISNKTSESASGSGRFVGNMVN